MPRILWAVEAVYPSGRREVLCDAETNRRQAQKVARECGEWASDGEHYEVVKYVPAAKSKKKRGK